MGWAVGYGCITRKTKMPNNIIVISSRVLESLREKAKKLKKTSSIAHHEALDAVARDCHCANWPHLVEAAKITALSEEGYKRGFVIGMDIKNAQPLKTDKLVEDKIVSCLIESDFRKSRGELTEDDTYFIEELRDEIIYFRYEGNIPKSHDDAMDIVSEYFFFDPQYLWLNGEWLSTQFRAVFRWQHHTRHHQRDDRIGQQHQSDSDYSADSTWFQW
jgi:hypothetical protein